MDPLATVRCRHCDKWWPARMHSCPRCLAELRPDPAAAAEALVAVLAAGYRLPRPPSTPAFRAGAQCTLTRLVARGGLVYTGPDGLIEASVDCCDGAVDPPLTCTDLDGRVLFRLEPYIVAPRALTALAADGEPVGTYLQPDPLERRLEVRDGASAPAAALVPRQGCEFELVETGGQALAACAMSDAERDGWLDDDWSLRATAERLPLPTLGLVAMLLAAKALLGRRRPVAVRQPPADWESVVNG